MLMNIANDRNMMSQGNNYAVVQGLLSVVQSIKNIQGVMQTDRMNDMFSMNVASKIMELESIVEMFGNQRLMSCGINVNMMGGMQQQQMSPLMANNPMYNQQMFYPQNMMGGMQQPMQQQYPPQQQYPQQQMPPQQQAPQPIPEKQQPAPAPIAAPPPVMQAPAPEAAAIPMAAAAPEAAPTAKPASSGPAVSMALPGMGGGGNEKAAGRDYLLQLLSEK